MSLTPKSIKNKSTIKHRRSISSSNAACGSASSTSSTSSAISMKIARDESNHKQQQKLNSIELNARNLKTSPSKRMTTTPETSSPSPIQLPVSLLVNQNTDPKANTKSNVRFHELFPSVPIEEYVIESM